jgi:hypothetical protein
MQPIISAGIRLQLPHQPAGFLGRITPTGPAQPKELDQIQPPLTQLQTANEAALPLEFRCQFSLR